MCRCRFHPEGFKESLYKCRFYPEGYRESLEKGRFNPEGYKESFHLYFHTGSILEGPTPDTLKPIVEQAMPMLIELLKDSSIVVRDTTAWTVGRVCEILPDAVINEHFLIPLLQAMVEGLTAEPRVAANVCWVRWDTTSVGVSG